MKFQVVNFAHNPSWAVVRVRCPACKRQGTFDPLPNIYDLAIQNISPTVTTGQRRCPNPECQALLFFAQQNGKILVSYPPELLDFYPVNIPPPVLAAFEYPITSHPNLSFTPSTSTLRTTI